MPLSPEEVRRIKAMNDKGEMPDEIIAKEEPQEIKKEEQYFDVTGAIELPMEKRRKKKKKKKSPGQGNQQEGAGQNIQRNRPDRPRENRSQENKPQQNRPPVSGEGPKEPNDTKPEPPVENTADGTPGNSDAGKKKKKRWYNNKK